MKKMICIFLALILALSCCPILSVSAADNETQESSPVYLLGDTNLDGEVTILDATLIQRYLVNLSELSGLQVELGNIYGEGLNITCATAIQRYLAGYETEKPIGEDAADENEGVVYPEAVMYYSGTGETIVSQTDNMYFSTAYPGVAFISDGEIILTYCQYFGYSIDDCVPMLADKLRGYQLPNGSVILFDYENKQMIFSDYSTTVTVNGSPSFNPFGNGLPAVFTVSPYTPSTLFEFQPSTKYFGSDPCIATFDYDEVPMLIYNEVILVPLQVLNDFFLSQKSSYIQYNGKACYMLTKDSAQNAPALWRQYMDETEKVDISGQKTWADNNNQDGIRPASITVNLLADGKTAASKTVTERDEWKWTFAGVDKYSAGKEIQYTVSENPVPGYTASSTGFDLTKMKLTTSQISATYDLHCFAISVSWVPTGQWESWNFRIAAKASALSDLLQFKKAASYWDK